MTTHVLCLSVTNNNIIMLLETIKGWGGGGGETRASSTIWRGDVAEPGCGGGREYLTMYACMRQGE